MWHQHLLVRGGFERCCWLDRKLRPGQVVTLKKDDGLKWRVKETYGVALSQPPRQDWHNNI